MDVAPRAFERIRSHVALSMWLLLGLLAVGLGACGAGESTSGGDLPDAVAPADTPAGGDTAGPGDTVPDAPPAELPSPDAVLPDAPPGDQAAPDVPLGDEAAPDALPADVPPADVPLADVPPRGDALPEVADVPPGIDLCQADIPGGDGVPPPTATAFSLGYAEVDVTPPVGTVMGGYGFPGGGRTSRGTHDPAYAQVALFQNDAGLAFMIVSVDTIGYFYDYGDWGPGVKTLRETIVNALCGQVALRPEHILVASSHTHCGADLVGFWQRANVGPDRELLDNMVRWIADAAVRAAADLQPVLVKSGQTVLDGYTRRDSGCSPVLDNTVAILHATDLGGTPRLTITNFGKHPTGISELDMQISADFVWGYREELRAMTGAPGMFLQGFIAAKHGGMGEGADDYAETYDMGRILATTVQTQLPLLAPAERFDIEHRFTHYSCPVDPDSFLQATLDNFHIPKRSFTKVGDTYVVDNLEVSWHRLGPAEFAVYPGEGTPDTAVQLRARMAAPTQFIVGLGNDEVGYIVDLESLNADTSGQLAGYELRMGLGIEAGPRTWEAMASLGWFVE